MSFSYVGRATKEVRSITIKNILKKILTPIIVNKKNLMTILLNIHTGEWNLLLTYQLSSMHRIVNHRRSLENGTETTNHIESV